MLPSYSKRFIQARGLGELDKQHYEVPEGKTAVIKCFSGLLHGGAFQSGAAMLGPLEGTIWQAITKPWEGPGTIVQGEGFLWYGSAVVYEGEKLWGLCLGGEADIYISGFLLSAEV